MTRSTVHLTTDGKSWLHNVWRRAFSPAFAALKGCATGNFATHSKYARLVALAFFIVSGISRPVAAQATDDLDPGIVKLVASVSEERLGATLKKLESFETRNTLSSTNSPTRGIGAAREWILAEMKSFSPKLQV